jgi:hypothetical protein
MRSTRFCQVIASIVFLAGQPLELPDGVSPVARGRHTRPVGQHKERFPILGLTCVGGGELSQPERPLDGNRVGLGCEFCGEPEAERGDVFQCGGKVVYASSRC